MIYSCTEKLYNLGVSIASIPSIYCGKILRTCVFQHVENGGLFERGLIRTYKFFSQRICSIGYDAKRAERAREILEECGATFTSVAADNNVIDTVMLSPQTLEEKINALGGQWQRVQLHSGKVVFAIIPPENLSEGWLRLAQHFSRFNWLEKDGFIITCASAENIDTETHLFIQLNSASTSYVMLQKKIGFFLGAKQKIVLFDPPGSGLSRGVASEGAYYSAVRAVFNQYANGYPLDRIWICGTCLGCMSAAYMKSKIPELNLILENGFVDLQEDMVRPEGRFPYWFARRYAQSLSRNDEDETNFNIMRMWESNRQLGKVIIVSVDNDQRLSSKVASKLVSLASRTSASVAHIHYRATQKDAHFSRYNDFPDIAQEVLDAVFESKSDE